MSRAKWLVERVVPEIVSRAGGTFIGVDVEGCEGGNPADGGLASLTFRMKLRLKQNEKEKEHLLITKIIPEEPLQRALQNSESQFNNETLWYMEVVPAMQALAERTGTNFGQQWPKCYSCVNESAEFAAIVMQDLKPEGYVLANLPASEIDFEHTCLTLERMAVLHAFGYTLRHHRPELYTSVVQRLQESWYVANRKDEQDELILMSIQRGIDPLRSRDDCADLVSALDQAIGDSPFNMQMELVRPKNKTTSVLCHGDLTRNNVLYKYDADGSLLDARLIDFAILRESSPAVDIATFFYLAVSPSVLEGTGLRNLLTHYHSTLVAALKQLSGPQDPWKGDVTALETELGRHVLLVYCICSFFLPIMMMVGQEEWSIADELQKPREVQLKSLLEKGGEKATQRLVDMLLDFQKRGFHKLWNIKT